MKNISKVITPEEFWGNFRKIQYHMDEPLADASARRAVLCVQHRLQST